MAEADLEDYIEAAARKPSLPAIGTVDNWLAKVTENRYQELLGQPPTTTPPPPPCPTCNGNRHIPGPEVDGYSYVTPCPDCTTQEADR
jgi:hypothetical protein